MKGKAIYITVLATLLASVQKAQAAGNTLIKGTGVSDETLFVVLGGIAIFQVVAIIVIAGVIKSIVSNSSIWDRKWNKAAVLTGLLAATASSPVLAQDGQFDQLIVMDDTGFVLLVALNLFLFVAFLYLVFKLNGLFRMLTEGSVYAREKKPLFSLKKALAVAAGKKAVEQAGEEKEMDHVYDGIRELDNDLPPWWVWGFYAGVVFAIAYLLHFHVFKTGDLMIAEYEKEVIQAEAIKAEFLASNTEAVDENTVTLLDDAARIASGEKAFKLNCAACHGQAGEGGVGPNLTDDYWLHGGDVKSIFKTIKYGVPEKGMVSWKATFSPGQIQELSSYIKTLRGTGPPNAKEPQGELFTEE